MGVRETSAQWEGSPLRFLGTSESLASKFRTLGADNDDLKVALRAVKRHLHVAAGDDVIRAGDSGRHSTVLLAGMTCSYKRGEDGGRNILSFQHPGDFCDLYRYVLPERDSAVGIQALTDCSVAVVDYRDIDQLLARRRLALAFWRATIIEAAIYRERLANANRGTALKRVAHLLCEQLARREAIGINDARLPLSQIDVADATGLSVVHVNRTIQCLRGREILSKAGHLEVTDRKQLAQIAKFDGSYLNMPQVLSGWSVQVKGRPGRGSLYAAAITWMASFDGVICDLWEPLAVLA
jgi:CRP-like cAMP-binding protein